MTCSVLICTFGERVWLDRGAALRASTREANPEALEVMAWHSPGASLAEVRNYAGKAAQGEWLCFLDADDELRPGYVRLMLEEAERGPGVLYPRVQYVGERGRAALPIFPGKGRKLIDLNRAVIGSLIPRDLFLDLGGFGPEPIYEDWDLWLRASRVVKLRPVVDAVYRVYIRPGSRNTDPAYMRHWYNEIRARYLEDDVRPA